MALPNPGMSFTPFDPLAASELNDIVENVEALATGSALDNNAITTADITDANVTPAKWTNPYKFSVTNSTGKTVTTGADRQLTFDTETYDTNNNFASSAYTAPVAGYYRFTGFVSWPSTGSMTRMIMRLFKNGTSIARLADVQTGTAACACGGSVTLLLAATNTITLYVQPVGAGTTTNFGAEEYYLQGELITIT